MNFAYTARTAIGEARSGEIAAVNREDAIQKLQNNGLQITKLDFADNGSLFPARVSRSDIIYMTSQLAIMVETGITLSAAIEGLCEQEENPTLRRVLTHLKEQVEAGEEFSVALSKYPRYFDKTFIALIKASEQTGTLGEMLDRISGFLRKQMDNAAKVRGALAYPAVMVVLAIAVTIFLLTYVLPQFEPLFTRKGASLPAATIVMMGISDVLLGYWWAWIPSLIATGIGLFFFRRTAPGVKTFDWLKLHLPIVGPMYRKVILSRSISTLGTMVESGVSMLEAIKLCAEVSGNYYYEKSWLHVLDEITNGNTICAALMGNPLFPRTLVQMIDSGEETGKLDFVLKRVSVYYDSEVDNALKTMTSLLEPLMITVMGFVVGGIAMGLLLPIFSLSRGG